MPAVRNQNLVIVVDDDPGMLGSLGRLLRQLGYASLLFPSAEALANHDHFDGVACILLDIDLGDGSGIELRHRLRARNISVPIIYMTGHDNVGVRDAAYQSGCLACLVNLSRLRRSPRTCGGLDRVRRAGLAASAQATTGRTSCETRAYRGPAGFERAYPLVREVDFCTTNQRPPRIATQMTTHRRHRVDL